MVDESIKEDLKSSRSVEDINSASIEERILRITGYYGYQPWNAVYKSKQFLLADVFILLNSFVGISEESSMVLKLLQSL